MPSRCNLYVRLLSANQNNLWTTLTYKCHEKYYFNFFSQRNTWCLRAQYLIFGRALFCPNSLKECVGYVKRTVPTIYNQIFQISKSQILDVNSCTTCSANYLQWLDIPEPAGRQALKDYPVDWVRYYQCYSVILLCFLSALQWIWKVVGLTGCTS